MTRPAGLPLSAVLAWWATAWLRGRVGPDDLLDAVTESHVTHVVRGEDGGLLGVLAPLRAAGATGLAAVFPVPGDLRGLGGPASLTDAALEAGQAVVAVGPVPEPGLGLVPHEVGRAVEWERRPAGRRAPPDVGDADRELRSAVLASANELARLDVARWRPEIADRLHDLRSAEPVSAPPGVPARAADLAGRALHLWSVTELALTDDGAAVSAGEIAARRDAVLPLERAARHALAAACAPDGWPPESAPGSDNLVAT